MTSAIAMNNSSETRIVGHYVDGKIVNVDSKMLNIINPATGQLTCKVAIAKKETVQAAIKAAESAFPDWRNTPPLKRARIMFKFKELLEQNADDVVALITEEHGKVLDDARGEFMRGVVSCGICLWHPRIIKR